MNDRGVVLPIVLVIVVGGMLAAGLAIDLGRWGAAWREAAFAADAGAEAGAAMIDEAAAYADQVRLDPRLARSAALEAAAQARPRADRRVSAIASTADVCVTVSQPFRPTVLRAVGAGTLTTTARACARPAKG